MGYFSSFPVLVHMKVAKSVYLEAHQFKRIDFRTYLFFHFSKILDLFRSLSAISYLPVRDSADVCMRFLRDVLENTCIRRTRLISQNSRSHCSLVRIANHTCQ